MKKLSLIFAATAVVGVMSAFTTASSSGTLTYVKEANGTEHLYSEVQNEGACVETEERVCHLDESRQPINPGEDMAWDFF